jgi:hypothetical protein
VDSRLEGYLECELMAREERRIKSELSEKERSKTTNVWVRCRISPELGEKFKHDALYEYQLRVVSPKKFSQIS